MSQVLASAGLRSREVTEWLQATRRVYNLNRVYVGQMLSLLVDQEKGELHHLTLEIDSRTRLVAERRDGRVVASREPIPHERHVRAVHGEITSSLYDAAIAKRIPRRIISDMAEILGWEINFSTDLRSGASFDVVYDELRRVGSEKSVPGRVLSLKITNRGRTHEGFYFEMPDGTRPGYYNREGEALGRAFLRYPVEFSRISSRFSRARYHPLLKRRRPHYGVDFAAPAGTPVRAVADGTVRKASWDRGNGRVVKIRHGGIYTTDYAHLSRIAPRIKRGVTVTKGQVIGYVGSSGLATGPHLHFVMHRHGRYIDPLKADLPRGHSLSGTALALFRATVDIADRAHAQVESAESGATQVAKAAVPE
jgi:murein DD-endopeptidase MepM/ murein hydrolase activator NlpD